MSTLKLPQAAHMEWGWSEFSRKRMFCRDGKETDVGQVINACHCNKQRSLPLSKSGEGTVKGLLGPGPHPRTHSPLYGQICFAGTEGLPPSAEEAPEAFRDWVSEKKTQKDERAGGCTAKGPSPIRHCSRKELAQNPGAARQRHEWAVWDKRQEGSDYRGKRASRTAAETRQGSGCRSWKDENSPACSQQGVKWLRFPTWTFNQLPSFLIKSVAQDGERN